MKKRWRAAIGLSILGGLAGSGCATSQWRLIDSGRELRKKGGDPTEVRKDFFSAVQEAQAEHDDYVVAIAYMEIGLTYADSDHDFEKAGEYFSKSRTLSDTNSYYFLLAEDLYNLGALCKKKGDLSPACVRKGCESLKNAQSELEQVKAVSSAPPQGASLNSIAGLERSITSLNKVYRCK